MDMSFKKFFISLLLFFSVCPITKADDNVSLREMFQNNNSVMYSLNIRTFNSNDINRNGIIDFSLGETSGSFINAIERLPELKELGINTVHLLPINSVGKIKALGTAGSLYAIADFLNLNPQLIDNESDLSLREQARLFIDECHKRGIKVVVDLPSCGSFDMFLNRPDLFVKDEDDNAFVPHDWTDVRLFDVPNDEKLLKSDIFILHKLFVTLMLNLGVDGIRADVATIKPYIFWKELIKFTREKNPDFMFLAEASEMWTQPATENAYFTDYKKLLEAGFDGYYGNYFDVKNWNTMTDLKMSVLNHQKILKKYKEKKSVIGSFATHDVVSPLITGGENFSKIIIWLNATLPLNPYYVDGFIQADDYIYEYSNKKAVETFTDDEYYYVHQGQIDIFNFSRKPSSDSNVLVDEHKLAISVRNQYLDVITKGTFVPLKSNNDSVYAYKRCHGKNSVYVIINRNLVNSENIKIKIGKIKRNQKRNIIKAPSLINIEKSMLSGRLKPAEIVVFSVEKI